MREGKYAKAQGAPMNKPKNRTMKSYVMGDNPNKRLPAKSLTPKARKKKR